MPTRGLNERKRAYMLGKFRRHAVIAAGMALAAGSLVVGSAQAHPDSKTITCTIDAQTATVHNTTHDPNNTNPKAGLYYPPTDPNTAHTTNSGDNFTWTFNGDCAESGIPFTSAGTGKGWCGRSVGNGTGTIGAGANAHTYKVTWESVATQLILTDATARGSVNANPLATLGQGSCTDGTATKFVVTGVITHSFPS